ncbi:hypothetical protein DSM3645_02838 [Blastopirellula marina DSM 3645]|uniref:Uncharacterized protein n=1 Tax=Blastopirellula marina DSM 3645 TaxID=314230 RepID=A3ZVN1_9BACT|nr:hypothetical protein DSM3645_02838 [Blastopirellula marina DSM 3645]
MPMTGDFLAEIIIASGQDLIKVLLRSGDAFSLRGDEHVEPYG